MPQVKKNGAYVYDPHWRCPRLLPEPEKRDPDGLVMCRFFEKADAGPDPTPGAGFCADPDIAKVIFNQQCPTDGWT
ncbi:MAG: hypothetical protein ABSC45_02380 [Desulfobaccales bacterium]|jgi:hypothetical protein